jgi:uncharacterized hydrophobic protein (TIGR00271 family)
VQSIEPEMRPAGRWTGTGPLLHGGRVEQQDLDALRAKLFFDLEPTGDGYVRFAVLLVLSVLIATGGVMADSTATVIGAMIVAPLMTPIMATAFALVTADVPRVGRSVSIVIGGAAVAIGLSYLFAVISPVFVDATSNAQIVARVSPRGLDLIIALASGAAGAFALSRANVADALPGVAIAISLVPPLSVVGVTLANGDQGAAAGAFLLFLTNFLAIIVAGGGMLAAMGYGRAALGGRSSRSRRHATIVVAAGTMIVLVPLAITSAHVARDAFLERMVPRSTLPSRLSRVSPR